jgi:uncharacterized membrane protein YphA (DoxX/SURF4 family)
MVAAFWVKLPTQGYAAARLDLMLMGGGATLYLLGAGRWSIDSVWVEKLQDEADRPN